MISQCRMRIAVISNCDVCLFEEPHYLFSSIGDFVATSNLLSYIHHTCVCAAIAIAKQVSVEPVNSIPKSNSHTNRQTHTHTHKLDSNLNRKQTEQRHFWFSYDIYGYWIESTNVKRSNVNNKLNNK